MLSNCRGLLEERLKEKKSRLGEVEEGIKKFVPDVALGDASANNGLAGYNNSANTVTGRLTNLAGYNNGGGGRFNNRLGPPMANAPQRGGMHR